MRWQQAMRQALYGPGGFFVTGRPADHFRTSVHASPLFAEAVGRLLVSLDEALGRPAVLDVVDIGAGRGELLGALAGRVPAELAGRLRRRAVELAPRPVDLDPAVEWLTEPPAAITGLLLATEWLDNVPVDVVERDDTGVTRYLLVDDSLGEPVTPADADWLARWWPLTPGTRAEVGAPRDTAWAGAVAALAAGLALTVDYGHLVTDRPLLGSLTGYRDGRQVPPVPDGSTDLTAHVAFDALTTSTSLLLRQRDALHALGISGRRPPLALASTDPAGYLRALATAGLAGELTDPAGLGGHFWLLQPAGAAAQDLCRGLRTGDPWHDARHDP